MMVAMTRTQKLTLELSKTRQRLNHLAGIATDDLTDEHRAELATLETRYADQERQYRAAVMAEAEAEAAAVGLFADGSEDADGRELRELIGKVRIGDYLAPAAAGVGISGAAAELAAALELPTTGPSGGVAIPLRVLLPDGGLETRQDDGRETRALTTTANYAGPVKQRPILDRLFAPGILEALGVRLDSVPSGRAEWPLITAGAAPDMKTEATAADAAPKVTFKTEILKPKRLTGALAYSHEMNAQVMGLEPALRRDLAAAVRSKMSDQILNGDEATNAQDVDGFYTKLSAPDVPDAVATYADYSGSHAGSVDGIHAEAEGEISSVIGVASYQHAAGVFQTGSGESGTEALKRRSRSCRASAYIPAALDSGARANVQDGNIYHAAGGQGGASRGDSIAAVWPSIEVIRDPYSNASTGVTLTWVSLWDAQTCFRAAAYRRVAFKLA